MFKFKETLIAMMVAVFTFFIVPTVSANTDTGIAPAAAEKPCVHPSLQAWMDMEKEKGNLHAVYEGSLMRALYLLTFASDQGGKNTEIRVYMEDKFDNVVYIGMRDGCYVNHTNKISKKGYLAIVDKMKGKKKEGQGA